MSVRTSDDGDFAWTNGLVDERRVRDGDHDVRATDLLLASLGVCVAATIQGFAESHGVEGLTGVTVEVIGTEIGPPTRVGEVNVNVVLEGELSEHDDLRLRRAATHCKIHNTLAKGVPIHLN